MVSKPINNDEVVVPAPSGYKRLWIGDMVNYFMPTGTLITFKYLGKGKFQAAKDGHVTLAPCTLASLKAIYSEIIEKSYV